MDKAERAKMLRQRFKATGGFPFVFTGVRKSKPVEPPRSREVYSRWHHCEATNLERVSVWVKQPNTAPRPDLREKRNQGKRALNRIAEKAPSKLVKSYQTAEALLAERAQR